MPKLKPAILVACLAIFSAHLFAQAKNTTKKLKLTEESIVIDSAGNHLPFVLWKSMITSREYMITPNADDSWNIHKTTAAEKNHLETLIQTMDKPVPSRSFSNGEAMYKIKTKDINGKTINTKELAGKIVVINYWFVNCPPCRAEIPELNKLVADYKNDSSVVFIGIALDNTDAIKEFLLDIPFDYQLVPDGRELNHSYDVNRYPTNVVIDREGKVYFHTSGFGLNTVYWIKKSIDEIKIKS